MLRDLLRHSEASESLDVLAVISPLNGDDSANVAAGLARALASAGSDVVVVDADFRGSLLAGVFGVADRPGLADLLEGLDASVALRDVDCPDGRLRVLPAGAVDASAEHRLRSERLAAVIDAIAERCDVVVIDTPPLLLTGDALAVLTQASGVVGVFELGATPRGAVRRTREMVASAGGHLLGAVTTGQPG